MDSRHALGGFELQAARREAASPPNYLYGAHADDSSPSLLHHHAALLSTQQPLVFSGLPLSPQPPVKQPAEYLAVAPKAPAARPMKVEVPMPKLQNLVNNCNTFNHGCWNLNTNQAYLCLPDEKSTTRIFGVLHEKVMDVIAWPDHGFEILPDVTSARSKGVLIEDPVMSGRIVKPVEGLTTEDINQKFAEINANKTYRKSLPALADWDGNEHVRLVTGWPGAKVTDKLGVYLGVLQLGVHLTIYTKDEQSGQVQEIYAQRRSINASSYPDMLDQTAAGGLQHNETPREGVSREAKEEFTAAICGRIDDRTQTRYDGAIVFSAVRPKSAKKIAGNYELSAKACYSLGFSDRQHVPQPQNGKKRFEWMTVARVLEALKNDEFKPNCALVMIKFLIDKGVINSEEEGFDTLCKSLTASIPLPLPDYLEPYGATPPPPGP